MYFLVRRHGPGQLGPFLLNEIETDATQSRGRFAYRSVFATLQTDDTTISTVVTA